MQTRCSRCDRSIEFEGNPPWSCPHCGQTTASPSDPTLQIDQTVLANAAKAFQPAGTPGRIGPYRLLRLLGSGGMGEVHLAEGSGDGKQVAVKVLSPECASSPGALERFRQEGRLAGMISHPRCVFVLAADEDAGRPYIVMERMPGRTLADLLRERGPLDPQEAVRLVLDVVEGLEEAHRHGVIHRDVKPSNCFLDTDGRVKVGDFGLSKSVSTNARLTQSGSFLGTPLYASPEQIKGEALDARTDVYSVCATLYALLSGKAPFEGTTDAIATLARIASEPPVPLRTLRPTISPAVERVVMRGLERDRAKRWKDMAELREALEPLVAVEASAGTLAARLGAHLFDLFFVVWPMTAGLQSACVALVGEGIGHAKAFKIGYRATESLASCLYFVLLEGNWGWSIGKRLLRLRVCLTRSLEPPGWRRAAVRTAVYFVLIWLFLYALDIAYVEVEPPMWLSLLGLAGIPLGSLALCCSMRKRGGYRGLHDLVSGTRVVLLAPPDRSVTHLTATREDVLVSRAAMSEGVPPQVGPFQVKGALRWNGREGVLVAQDPTLPRSVLIDVRIAQGASDARRSVGRSARLRWLASGTLGEASWDAYVAPAGRPLSVIVRKGSLSWAEARPILDQLADELAAAAKDGTLPTRMNECEVWVQPHGQVQCVDVSTSEHGAPASDTAFERQPLVFLYRTALLALTGKASVPDDPRVERYVKGRTTEPPVGVWRVRLALVPLTVLAAVLPYVLGLSYPGVRALIAVGMGIACDVAVRASRRKAIRSMRAPLLAPIPLHATAMLDRLPGGRDPYADVEGLRSDLAATKDRPREADVRLRSIQLGLTVPLLLTFAGVPLLYGLLVLAWVRLTGLDECVVHAERVEKALREGSLSRSVASLPEPDPGIDVVTEKPEGGRVRGREAISTLCQDPTFRERLLARLKEDSRELEDLRAAANWAHLDLWHLRGVELRYDALPHDPSAPQDLGWDDLIVATAHASSDGAHVTGLPALYLAWSVPRALGAVPSCVFLAECLLWALFFRGGASYRLAGLEIVSKDGLPASGIRCAMRAFFAWLPFAFATALVTCLELALPSLPWLFRAIRYTGVTTTLALFVLLISYLVLALRFPSGALHDRLARTRVVPR